MKTAKELFEELGYKIVRDDDEFIKYESVSNEDLYIVFYKTYKVILGEPTYDYFCDMDLLKAINKQIEELKWNE